MAQSVLQSSALLTQRGGQRRPWPGRRRDQNAQVLLHRAPGRRPDNEGLALSCCVLCSSRVFGIDVSLCFKYRTKYLCGLLRFFESPLILLPRQVCGSLSPCLSQCRPRYSINNPHLISPGVGLFCICFHTYSQISPQCQQRYSIWKYIVESRVCLFIISSHCSPSYVHGKNKSHKIGAWSPPPVFFQLPWLSAIGWGRGHRTCNFYKRKS